MLIRTKSNDNTNKEIEMFQITNDIRPKTDKTVIIKEKEICLKINERIIKENFDLIDNLSKEILPEAKLVDNLHSDTSKDKSSQLSYIYGVAKRENKYNNYKNYNSNNFTQKRQDNNGQPQINNNGNKQEKFKNYNKDDFF